MSDNPASDPASDTASESIEVVIRPKTTDLGEFTVRRALPSPARRAVGPFIFFDHMGPAEFPPGQGVQVRPHPHIGLSTVTYLFEGEIIHRDNLGYVQPIQAGAVNLMTAGRGIVHSERAGEDLDTISHLHGIQSWMALPTEEEECDPEFVHYPAEDIPGFEHDGVAVRVIIGGAWGHQSPVAVQVPTLYLECKMPKGTALTLPMDYEETAAYVVSGVVHVDGQQLSGGLLAVARPGQTARLEAVEESHVMILGGENLGERHLWWNLVSSSKERIEQAKEDWQQKRFDPVPGEHEFIPLPKK
jgi:redox-sensitive bicupin YhaK (pirin superfamily)